MAMEEGMAKGVKKGVKKGVRKGVRKGVKKGKATTLRTQLAQRFGPLPEWVEQRLEKADEQELESWIMRVLTATSLEEIFDGR